MTSLERDSGSGSDVRGLVSTAEWECRVALADAFLAMYILESAWTGPTRRIAVDA